MENPKFFSERIIIVTRRVRERNIIRTAYGISQ